MSPLRFLPLLILLSLSISPLSTRAHSTDKEIFLKVSALVPQVMDLTEFGAYVSLLAMNLDTPSTYALSTFLGDIDQCLHETKNKWVYDALTTLKNDVIKKDKDKHLENSWAITSWFHTHLQTGWAEKADKLIADLKGLCHQASDLTQENAFIPLILLNETFCHNIEASFLASAIAEFGHLETAPDAALAFLSIFWSMSPTKEGFAQLILRKYSGSGFNHPIPLAAKAFYICFLKKFNKNDVDLKPYTQDKLINAWNDFYAKRIKNDNLAELGLGDFLLETCPNLTPDLAAALLEASAPARKHAMNCKLQQRYFIPYGAKTKDKSREPAMTKWIQYLQEQENN